jgi:hypothetical protein
MSAPPLAKAQLIPFGDAPNAAVPDGSRAIPFDFNPETLTLKVSSAEARDGARRGRQQTQNVGASQATLSFECQFDSTHPRAGDGAASLSAGVEQRDVRRRTRAIADLLQDVDPGRQVAPRRVRFLWGQFLFDGVVSQHQETFDYFSAEGVPLRSKVSLTLTEKSFRYNVTAEQAQPPSEEASGQAAAAGASDQPPAETSQQRRETALAAALVPEVPRPSTAQIGQRLAAGLPLGALEALAVFGSAALPAGAVLPALPAESGRPGAPSPGRPASAWGREAAPAGSAAAAVSAQVVAERQAGLDPGPAPASPSPRAVDPPPIRGHAHLRARLALEPDPRLFPLPPQPERSPLERRPRWEPEAWRRPRAGVLEEPGGSARGGCHCGCGCVPCRGGRP